MWKDLNSSFYVWVRWGIFFNQLFWSIVSLIGLSANNNTMALKCYFIGLIPGLGFLFYQNIIPVCNVENDYKMHAREWICFRCVIITVALIFIIVWGATKMGPFLLGAWFAIFITLMNEGLIVGDIYQTCGDQPYQMV